LPWHAAAAGELLDFDLDLQELFWSMFFLFLRDELRSPAPVYQGRQFALDRYAEILHSASREPWRLESAFQRIAIGLHRTARWGCCDYSYVSANGDLFVRKNLTLVPLFDRMIER
jgi:hypothetical protein